MLVVSLYRRVFRAYNIILNTLLECTLEKYIVEMKKINWINIFSERFRRNGHETRIKHKFPDFTLNILKNIMEKEMYYSSELL